MMPDIHIKFPVGVQALACASHTKQVLDSFDEEIIFFILDAFYEPKYKLSTISCTKGFIN